MSTRFGLPGVGALLLAAIPLGTPAALADRSSQPVPTVARYDVFEASLRWNAGSDNPQDRVRVDVTLRSPSGRQARIGGFYVGGNVWKFRFAPDAVGVWSWSARIVDRARTGSFRGSFRAVRGRSPGFVRRSPYNRFRWVFDNRSPFYPIGINDCTGPFLKGKPIDEWGLDGGFRKPGEHAGRLVMMDEYMSAYAGAGFDLFRWGPDNCSFKLYARIDPGGNVYSLSGGTYADRLFQALHRHGFRIEMVFFGSNPPFPTDADDNAKMNAVKRYVRYAVNRYGAYVDFWELMNEASASDAWESQMAAFVHSIDPYRHPVGTNWSKPELAGIDFGADHWYETEDVRDSDRLTWDKFQHSTARAQGKPTLIDEQGNIDQNWDPGSAVRMRLRAWTAFFAEGTIVFWNASFAKDYTNPNAAANIYLGPTERKYVRVLQSFTRGFDKRATIVAAPTTPSEDARSYALGGSKGYGLYLVAAGDRTTKTSGLQVRVAPQRSGRARWIDPATGTVLRSFVLHAGQQSIHVPPFTTDIALRAS